MNRIVRNAVLSAAVAATTLAVMPAEAGQRWHDRGRGPVVVQHQPDAGAVVAAGILGLAIGAIAVGAASNRQPAYDNSYRHPRPRPQREYFPAAPTSHPGRYADTRAYATWSPEWYRWCSENYRSFDPARGTYTLRPGVERLCVAQ